MRRAHGPSLNELTPEQQKQLEAIQQADMQRQLQRQQVLLHNGAGGLNAAMAANKKQREVYIGNLVMGAVNDVMLRELFNAALAQFVPDPVTNPPVVSVTMDGTARFGFVELRTEELAGEAMKLDKVELCGRPLNVGRPKGYIEPPPGTVKDSNDPTLTLFLENLLPVAQIRTAEDREDLRIEVEEECAACQSLERVVVPEPPLWVPGEEPVPVFVRFGTTEGCRKAKEMMNGRSFFPDGVEAGVGASTVTAKFISDDLWARVVGGEWVDHKMVCAPPVPVAMSGMTSLPNILPAVVNPASVNQFPNLLPAALMGAGGYGGTGAGATGAALPTSGYLIQINDLPPNTTKYDIVQFLVGCNLGEGHVRLLRAPGGEHTGKAYVDCPTAESMARAIAMDRRQMGDTGAFIKIASATVEERSKTLTGGYQLV